MKYLFIVQGEGRGHMTQAISLFNMLTSAGHAVPQVIVGKSKRRKIPDFFYKQLTNCEVLTVESPNFITDRNNKSIKIGATLIANVRKIPTFRKSLKIIDQKVKEYQPDVIINFYDFLGGMYKYTFSQSCHFVSIAHQYLAIHNDFPFAKGKIWDRASLKFGNRITALGSDKILALSFSEGYNKSAKITITPPLLRKDLKALNTEDQDFILVYMVNDGYAEEVYNFHKKHPQIKLHCFWDRKSASETEVVDETLTFHQISDIKFLKKMAECKAYASTAGFESICEAMYLGKPVMMVPVAKQYEQACNALDAYQAGAGIFSNSFDIKKLIDYLPSHVSNTTSFKRWADQCESIMLSNLTNFSSNGANK